MYVSTGGLDQRVPLIYTFSGGVGLALVLRARWLSLVLAVQIRACMLAPVRVLPRRSSQRREQCAAYETHLQ
jgi:hypothetical protein